MAIQIKYDGGVYEIKGLLNAQNGESLRSHLEVIMQQSKGLVLSLNKVLDLDSNAVTIISELHRKASLSDTLFYIIGRQNKKVNELFCALNYNDILL